LAEEGLEGRTETGRADGAEGAFRIDEAMLVVAVAVVAVAVVAVAVVLISESEKRKGKNES
jgi:hypothetical protein